jgi:pilus assembly protein CpaF
MALMSDVDLPFSHVREQIATTIDLVVHVARTPAGRRVVSQITSVEGLEEGRVVLRDAFNFRTRGNGGTLEPTGHVPRIVEALRAAGERINTGLFGPQPVVAEDRAPRASVGTRVG